VDDWLNKNVNKQEQILKDTNTNTRELPSLPPFLQRFVLTFSLGFQVFGYGGGRGGCEGYRWWQCFVKKRAQSAP
jgi:hypothetical protein